MNKMNIGIISLNCGGTAGHMSLTTKLSNLLAKKKNNIFLITDNDYSIYFKNKKFNFKIKKLKRGKHRKTVGGCLNYNHYKSLISLIENNNISTLIFSTFYDLKILEYCKIKKIKTILISYPLRDSHREAIKSRGYYKNFYSVLTLNEIYNVKRISSNEKIVSPLKTKAKNIPSKEGNKFNVLVTCGGGGRPSSELFFNKIKQMIPLIIKKHPNAKIDIIKGNYKLDLKLYNGKVISWSAIFPELLNKNDLIISEAGYYTLVDLISLSKKAILIPGERRIDNQELRAIKFEQSKSGIAIFPSDDKEELSKRLDFFLSNLKGNTLKLKTIQNKLFSKPPIDKVILNLIKSA